MGGIKGEGEGSKPRPTFCNPHLKGDRWGLVVPYKSGPTTDTLNATEFVADEVENVGPDVAVSLHRENDKDQLPNFRQSLNSLCHEVWRSVLHTYPTLK